MTLTWTTRHDRLPIRIVVSDDLERSRVTVFFRLMLAIPHLVVVALWGIAAAAVSIVLWLALLFEGKAPRTLQSFVISFLRYSVQVSAYVHLAAGPYPSFGGGDGYPVDLEVDPSLTQSRGRVAARLVLAFPALLIAGALGGGSWFGDVLVARLTNSDSGWNGGWSAGGSCSDGGVLAWFAHVVRGRTPRGLRDLIAYCIGVHGAGARLPASRHRPLPDERPESDRAVRRAAATSRPARARRTGSSDHDSPSSFGCCSRSRT